MKRSGFYKLLSMLLVFALLVELLPTNAFAAPAKEDDYLPSAQEEAVPEKPAEAEETDEEEAPEAAVIGEITELREENIKHFRMDDGSFIAVDYGMPVHFTTDDGESWEPIDNTLTLTDEDPSADEQIENRDSTNDALKYVAANGDKTTSFASSLDSGFLFSSENGTQKISMSLANPGKDSVAATEAEIIEAGIEMADDELQEEESDSDAGINPSSEESTAPEIRENIESMDLVEGTPDYVSELDADNNLIEAYNTDATAEITYPENEQKQRGQSNAEGDDYNGNMPSALAALVAPSRLTANVLYQDVYDEVDLSYSLCGYDVKEEIIVKARRDSYDFSFYLNIGNLTPNVQEDGSILFTDSENQSVFRIPAPFMYDASAESSSAVSYSLSKTATGVLALTISADSDWINAEGRVFPVTIDPTLEIETSATSKSIISSYVISSTPDSQPYDNKKCIDVGTTSSSVHRKGLIYIKDIPPLPDAAIVTESYLAMYNIHAPLDAQYVNLYSSSSTAANSNPESFLNNATWNSISSLPYGGSTSSSNRTILDYAAIFPNETGWCTWNITGLLQSWYDGTGPSRLLVLEGEKNTGSPYVYFRGYKNPYGARPTLIVHYQNTVGLEDYYCYQSQDIGLAGSGSVNNYTLDLTISEPLASCPSVTLPFSFALFYNSARAENICTKDDGYITRGYSGHAGRGWKLSVQQTVYSLSIDEGDGDSVLYLVYLDADGTEHYFKYDNEKAAYCDEDGLNLSITITTNTNPINTTYNMTDDNNNTWEFYNGYLTKNTDYNGNSLFFSYDSISYSDNNTNWKPSVNSENHKVTGVWRKNNGGTLESLLTLQYNANGCVASITERGARTTTFSYESRSVGGTTAYYLHEINCPGDRIAQYQYETITDGNETKHLLTQAYDSEANYGIQYSYFWKLGDYRIRNIFEYHLNNNNQEETRNKMHMYKTSARHSTARFYGANMQSTDDGTPSADTADDIVTVYNFDDYGKLTSAFSKDGSGKILGAATADYTKKEGTKADNNRMTHAAQTGGGSRNLLDNGGIESSVDAWTYWEYNANYASGIRADSTISGQIDSGISPNHGQFVLRTSVSSASAGSTAQAVFYRPVELVANETYTLSAYVNTNKITNFRHKNVGVFFALPPSTSSPLSPVAYDSIDYSTTATASGWERLSVTYKVQSNGQYWVGVCQNGPAGVVYYDDIQLEQFDAASAVNLLSCGSFERDDFYSYWNRSDATNVVLANASDGTHSLKIQGASDAVRKASQSVSIKKSAEATFLLSGWGKANSAPNAHNEDLTSWKPFFGLIASIVYENSSEPAEQHRIPFASNTEDWQFTSGVVVPKYPERTIDRIDVFVSYHNNINTAYFDNICLRQEPVQTYGYDSDNGKLLSSTQTENDETTYVYDPDHRLKQYKTISGVTYDIHYDDGKRDPREVESDGLKTTYTYDEDNETNNAGIITKIKVTGTGTSRYFESTASYDSSKNYQLSETNVNQITTNYTYDSDTGKVSTVKIPLGNGNEENDATIHYSYYVSGRAKSTFQDHVANISYAYDTHGRLDKLKRKTFLGESVLWQAYDYAFNSWGQPSNLAVKKSTQENGGSLSSGKVLAYYSYYSNGSKKDQTYSNGDKVTYTYDLLDRLVQKQYNDSSNMPVADYRYVYDAQGNLAKQYAIGANDSHSEEYRFEYDSLGRLIRSRALNSDGSTSQRTEHLYDTANRLSAQQWTVEGRLFSETYHYNNPGDDSTPLSDGSLASLDAATGDKLTFTYDNLKRPSRVYTKTTTGTTRFYTAQTYRYNTSTLRTTNQISGFSIRNSSDGIINYNRYYYDAAGNIKQIKQVLPNEDTRVLSEYKYDSLNQLTEEKLFYYAGNSVSPLRTDTIVYEYDTAGNIITTTESGIETVECTYADNNWPDLLTKIKVNGTSKNIFYQNGGAGNPDNWYNGTEYTNLTWTQGRRLASLRKGNTNISYTYDMEGIRTGKQAGNISHDYVTMNGKVVWDSFNGTELYFIYDPEGRPYAMQYSDAGNTPVTFYYMLNAQGDVIGLMDGNANRVVSYTYDAWGNILSSQSHAATYSDLDEINPLRYRGYYYDSETGWYYLQSRYYDPIVKRFLNSDVFASTGQGFIGNNMFAYCNNNPIMHSDPSGNYSLTEVLYTHTSIVSSDWKSTKYRTVVVIRITKYTNKDVYNSVTHTTYHVKEFTFTVSNEGKAHIQNDQSNASCLGNIPVSRALAGEIINVTTTQVDRALSRRSVCGVAREIRWHYYGFSVIPIDKLQEKLQTDIGGNSILGVGYDYNARFFEYPSIHTATSVLLEIAENAIKKRLKAID